MIKTFGLNNVTICIKPSKNDSMPAFVKSVRKGYQLTISDKLIELLKPDELGTVIAHESSHMYNKDDEIRGDFWFLSILCSILITGVICFRIHIPFLYRYYWIIPFILVITIDSLIMSKVSKIIEIRADIEAVKMTNKADSFIRAFDNMEDYNKHHKKSWLIKSLRMIKAWLIGIAYPTTEKRIEYIKQLNFDEIPSIDKERPKIIVIKAFKCMKGCIITVNQPPKGDKVDSLDWAIYVYHKFKC